METTVKIHATAIIESGAEIGAGTAVWDNVHIRRGAVVGSNCIIGEKTYIAGDAKVGDRCKLNACVYIPAFVTIEDGVMIAAHTVFTNDQFPRACTPDLSELLNSAPDENTRRTLVKQGATIGANCTIGNDLTIGRFAMVGMGAVVTRSVADFHMVIGVPAKPVACVCRCGHPLFRLADGPLPAGKPIECSLCGWRYRVTGDTVEDIGPGVLTAAQCDQAA
ncbi:MAG: N-acetyltransferase [Bryobacteraceae bacterium]